ncbi:MAG: alpha/beta hydrolase [Candidatus Melainabacteria bacterium]|nr:alpha/beta hydrolase [Candidatus Melainabacteria bacterium]
MQTRTPTSKRKKLARSKKRARLVITLLLVLLGGYLALSPMCSMWLYNKVLFFPWKYPGGYYQDRVASSIEPRDVWIALDTGSKLHGWWYQKPNAKRTVIIHHGQGGNLTFLRGWAAMFIDCDANVLIYDYEGYGRSEGEPGIDALRRDGLAAFDYVCKNEKISNDHIVNCGESLGTGVAAYVTEKRKTAGLILFSPYASVIECGQQRYPILYAYPRFMFPKTELECRTCLKGVHPPVLLIHGTEDWVIPISNSD